MCASLSLSTHTYSQNGSSYLYNVPEDNVVEDDLLVEIFQEPSPIEISDDEDTDDEILQLTSRRRRWGSIGIYQSQEPTPRKIFVRPLKRNFAILGMSMFLYPNVKVIRNL